MGAVVLPRCRLSRDQWEGWFYALNRLTQKQFQDGSTIGYTFDAADRLTQVSDSLNWAITHGYDNLDLLTSEVTPQGTVSYVNDVAGAAHHSFLYSDRAGADRGDVCL